MVKESHLAVLASLAALSIEVLGCGGTPEASAAAMETSEQRAELRAASGENGSSTAANLSTIDGIIGTVGILSWDRQPPDMDCTGTLVARQRFLTAAHCVVNNSAIENARVWFPQRQTQKFFVSRSEYLDPESPTLSRNNKVFSGDLAVLFLTEPVPTSIVESVAPVFTGDLDTNAFGRRPTLFHAIQAGIGYDNSGLTGSRKWGHLRTLRPSLTYLSGRYEQRLIADSSEARINGLLESNTDNGDSGGPVFMWMPSKNSYVVVGVTSGHDNNMKQVKAFTGKLGGLNHAPWLVPLLGEDVDNDWIPDNSDNCPPVFCANKGLHWSACTNTSQEDADGDGIGDKCDNCPQSVCDQLMARNPGLAIRFSCFNKSQANYDGDELGDACDPCPAVPNGRGLEDDDNDLVGNACDLCPEANPHQACSSTDDCKAGFCINEDMYYGRCSEQPDEDGDGVADVCDNCRGDRTTDIRNSNWLAERHYLNPHTARPLGPDEYLGDVCDAVPLFRLSPQEALVEPWEPRQGSGEDGGADIIPIGGETWIGKDRSEGPVERMDGRIAFRFCPCVDRGKPMDFGECTDRGRCNAAGWTEAAKAGWIDMTVRTVDGRTVVPGGGDNLVFNDRQAGPNSYIWRFYYDVEKGHVPSYSIEGSGYEHVLGLVGSHVESDDTAGERDRETGRALRTSVGLFQGPRFGIGETKMDFVEQCFGPRCLRLVRRPHGEEVINWGNWEDRIKGRLFEIFGNVAIVTREGRFLLEDGRAIDIGQDIDADVKDILADPDGWAWLPPIENHSLLRVRNNDVQAAVVPREGSGRTSPGQVAVRGGRLMLSVNKPEIDAPPYSVLGQLGAVVVPATGRAVFSAIRNKLYIAGGTINGEPTGRVRVYDFAADEWAPVPHDAAVAIGEDVRGLAFDPIREWLYVLEIDGKARLAQIDLRVGKYRPLFEVPYTGLYEKLGLAVDAEGMLVLIGSKGPLLSAWRIDVDPDGIDWKGRYVADGGEVVDELVFKGDVLAVPVAGREGGFVLEELWPARFVPGTGPLEEL